MVAVIHTSSSLSRALYYNEQKVRQGVATCILAGNYPKEVEALTVSQKLNRLQHQAQLNARTKVNSVHISLNFDPSEQLSTDKLQQIAAAYLEKIGFGQQPYLVYQHHDAAHPHLHLVTTNIQANSKRIELHNLGKKVSEEARQEIEQSFGLVKAKDHSNRQVYALEPISVPKVQYGKAETRRAIAQVLNQVLKAYKFTSLPELNAVLQQYNVVADQGSKNSRIYQHQGLLYRVLDGQGNKVGVPIKASDFYQKSTMKYLKARFKLHEIAREPNKARLKNAIDLAFFRQPNISLSDFIHRLKKEGIHTDLRRNEAGRIYGLTYVDHRSKSVFKGSDLGKKYSAAAIQERCAPPVPFIPQPALQVAEKRQAARPSPVEEGGPTAALPPKVGEGQPLSIPAIIADINHVLANLELQQ